MMRRVAVISNPASGRNRRGLDAIEQAATAAGFAHHAPPEDGLARLVRQLAADGVAVLAINGGDGTVVDVVSALRSPPLGCPEPLLAVLKGGTTNLVHGDVGLAGCRRKALARLAALPEGRIPRDSIVRRAPLVAGVAGVERFGFFLGLAAIPRAILHARGRWHRRGFTGPVSEALVLAQAAWRLLAGKAVGDPILDPSGLDWQVEKAPEHHARCILGYATTLERLVLGLRPVPPRGGLALLLLTEPYRHFARLLPALAKGRSLPRIPGLHMASGNLLRLRLESGWVLDGECIDADPGEILVVRADAPLSFVVV